MRVQVRARVRVRMHMPIRRSARRECGAARARRAWCASWCKYERERGGGADVRRYGTPAEAQLRPRLTGRRRRRGDDRRGPGYKTPNAASASTATASGRSRARGGAGRRASASNGASGAGDGSRSTRRSGRGCGRGFEKGRSTGSETSALPTSGGRRKDRPTYGRFWDTRGCHRERFYPGRFGAAVRAMEVAVWPPGSGDSAVAGSNSNGHGGYSTRVMSDLGASATAACSQLEGACQSR